MAESPRRSRLFDAVQLGGVLDDMRRQAAGLPGRGLPLAVVGVLRRGAPLADRCVTRLPLRADVVGLRQVGQAPPHRGQGRSKG